MGVASLRLDFALGDQIDDHGDTAKLLQLVGVVLPFIAREPQRFRVIIPQCARRRDRSILVKADDEGQARGHVYDVPQLQPELPILRDDGPALFDTIRSNPDFLCGGDFDALALFHTATSLDSPFSRYDGGMEKAPISKIVTIRGEQYFAIRSESGTSERYSFEEWEKQEAKLRELRKAAAEYRLSPP